MSVHICNNCELINEIINSKIKWCESLNSENISLHSSLQKITHENLLLRKQICDMQKFLYEEREQYLKLYTKNEILKIGTCTKLKTPKSCMEPKNQEPSSAELIKQLNNKSLMNITSLFEKQTFLYKCQIQSLSDDYTVSEHELRKEIQQLRTYSNNVTKMLHGCREELLDTKKENNSNYLKTISQIQSLKECNKIVLSNELKAEKLILKDEIKKFTGNEIRFLKYQVQIRDDLVATLQQQCSSMEKEMILLKQEKCSTQKTNEEKCRKLKEEKKEMMAKRNAIVTQKQLEGEGYKTDIRNLKKRIQQLEKQSADAKSST